MDLREYTRQYAVQDNRLAALSYFGTFAVYFASLALAIGYVDRWYVMVPAGVVFAFSAVRLYVLQHDCGHHSLFETRQQNEWAGHGLSPFTFAPFEVMKQNHNLHHAGIGNLEHRETGEIHTMTLREWNEADWSKRLFYRLYRNPFVLVPVGALFTYFIRYRWPKNTMRFGLKGVLLHNLSIVVFLGLLYLIAGSTGILVWLVFSLLGGMLGVFLVYLQHNLRGHLLGSSPGSGSATCGAARLVRIGFWLVVRHRSGLHHLARHSPFQCTHSILSSACLPLQFATRVYSASDQVPRGGRSAKPQALG